LVNNSEADDPSHGGAVGTLGYTERAMTTAHAQNAVPSLLVGGKTGAAIVIAVVV
jgi:hypothetical protein